MDSLFGAASSCERSIQHCLDMLAIWNEFDNASELSAQHICHLQLLSAKLCWSAVRWSAHEVEIPAPTDLDVQHLIQSCLDLIIDLAHDLAISHGDMEIIGRIEALNIQGSSGKRSTYLPDQDMEFQFRNKDNETPREQLELNLAIEEVEERLQSISDQILLLEDLLPPDPAPNGAAVFNVALSTGPLKLKTLSFPKDVDSFTPWLGQIKAITTDHINYITFIRSCSADELGISIEISKLRDNELGVSYFGKYNESLVFVHEKKKDSSLRHTLTRLTWQLKLSENIKELRILPCLGYTIDLPLPMRPFQGQEYIHHVIYAIPGIHAISLRDILSSRNLHHFQSLLSLTVRIEIAQFLARSVLYLHTAEWLHRGIRSSNVLFCSDVDFPDTQQLPLPYLAGFDYTYLPSEDEIINGTIQTEFRERQLYRHPNVQREPTTWLNAALGDDDKAFSKNHDIYGLGVILVELGVCKSAARLWSKRSRDKCNGESKFQGYLITEIIPEVGSIMGSMYADVALYCLQSDVYHPKGPDHAGAVAFYRNVIVQLERCKNIAI